MTSITLIYHKKFTYRTLFIQESSKVFAMIFTIFYITQELISQLLT